MNEKMSNPDGTIAKVSGVAVGVPEVKVVLLFCLHKVLEAAGRSLHQAPLTDTVLTRVFSNCFLILIYNSD